MELSVVIPAFNEAKRIGLTLDRIGAFLKSKGWTYEILVVDDGSTDETVALVEERKDPAVQVLKLKQNTGKGFAVKTGLMNARYSFVLFSDADLSTPIEDIDLMIPFLESYDVVIGSRNLPDSQITQKQPWFRSTLGKTFPALVRFMVLPGIRDSQCGFKLFKRKVVEAVLPYQTINGFGFDVELLYLCTQAGYLIKEVPIRWENADGSKVSPVKDSMRMFRDLFTIRRNNATGVYKGLK